MIIGKNSFIKGAIPFTVFILAILNLVGVSFSHHWLLISSGIITSTLVMWACLQLYRKFEDNIEVLEGDIMEIDFTKSLIDFDGREIIDNDVPMTFKSIISRLLAMCKADDKVMERWELAQRIYNSSGEIDITPSQIMLIQNALKESSLTTLVGGQIYHLLN